MNYPGKRIEVGIVSWLTSNCNLNSVRVTVLAKSWNINNSFTSVCPCIIPAGWCYCVVGVIWIFLNLYIIFIPPVSGFGVATGHTKQCSCGTFIQSWSCCSFECNCWAHWVKKMNFYQYKGQIIMGLLQHPKIVLNYRIEEFLYWGSNLSISLDTLDNFYILIAMISKNYQVCLTQQWQFPWIAMMGM